MLHYHAGTTYARTLLLHMCTRVTSFIYEAYELLDYTIILYYILFQRSDY